MELQHRSPKLTHPTERHHLPLAKKMSFLGFSKSRMVLRGLITMLVTAAILRTLLSLPQKEMLGYAGVERQVTPLNPAENVTTGTRADWAKETELPKFCQHILNNPIPFDKRCHRDGKTLSCRNFDGKTMMFSQFLQDYYLYTQHFINKTTPGVYVDVASNEPIAISNTYFFDRCLGWKGVCVEANPEYYERIYRMRSCQLVPTCVGNRDGHFVEFLLKGGAGGVLDESFKSKKKLGKDATKPTILKERCTTMKFVLGRENVQTIDYMSLDVEGHELKVLQGFDWEHTKVNVMTIEVNGETLPGIEEYLTGFGYKRHIPQLNDKTRKTGLLKEDAIFLHESVVFGRPE